MGGPCAGWGLTTGYKMAVARYLVDDRLPRVGDDVEAARGHMQRTLNALVAPGNKPTKESRKAPSLGYMELKGAIGNPVHGMTEPGMGVLWHLERAPIEHRAHAKDALKMVQLAREQAFAALKADNADDIKRSGRVVSHLLRAAHEVIL